MNEKIRLVLSGYIALTTEGRRRFVDEINRFINGTDTQRRQIETDLRADVRKIQQSLRESGGRMETGPLGPGCPCCGR
jgi:hypothetical protein